MASTLLFVQVPQTGNQTVLAGSGSVTRWTYTVPAGKRAIVRHVSVLINGNANVAATTQATIRVTIGGVIYRLITIDNSGVANLNSKELSLQVTLYPGDTCTGLTINAGAGNVLMIVDAQIEEYG